MAYEQKPGQGALFRNDKGDNQARPDYRGSINIEGTEYELSAWIREGKERQVHELVGTSEERAAGKSGGI